jgi:hypothetical protein
MELLDGHRSLRELLDERGRLGVAEAVRVARELLAGLRLIHDRALVHCDVKSGNVMLGPGPAKLIDFGISRPPDVPAETARSIGSVRSMAPEQLRGEALTPATDLFAVGVVLYEALTGAMPYGGDTPEEIMAAHQAEDVRPPSTRAEGIPTRLDAAILQALRVDPSSRFHSAAALDRALEASIAAGDDEETKTSVVADAIDDGYVPPPVPAPARRPEPAPRASREPARRAAARRRRPVVGIVGTALVLAMAVLVGLLVIVPLLRLGGGAGDPPAASATPAATATAPTRTVEVPRTIGMSKDEAIAAATAAGLNWTIQCAQDPQQPEGIIDQEPPAGTPVAPGSRFTMYSARIRDCR